MGSVEDHPRPVGTRPPERTLRLPQAVPAEKTPLPVAAMLGPIAAALILWLVTRSPSALLFAALSPALALFGVADTVRRRRRARAASARLRQAGLRRLRAQVAAARQEVLKSLSAGAPSAAELLARTSDPARWRADPGGMLLRVGIGGGPSGIRIEGEPADDDERELCDAAPWIADAPVLVPAAGGIGVYGPEELSWSVARGYLLQLVGRLSPARAALHASMDRIPSGFPHSHTAGGDTLLLIEAAGAAGVTSGGGAWVGHGPGGGGSGHTIRILVADALERIPPTIGTVLQVLGPGRARLVPADAPVREITVEHVGSAEASRYARLLADHAARLGLGGGETSGPVLLEDLPDPAPDGLACVIGVWSGGAPRGGTCRAGTRLPCHVDLVRDGPHAIVGGTTGSGKSELLTTWVAAMARTRTPQEVAFLLIDFKGGATFASLRGLPHCVGVITDLDEAGARRAVSSLAAEVRRRERALAEFGAATISDPACLGRIARLVIVVDEFQAMLQSLPDLDAVFTDLAARGRSLGIHLILCTQRPSGVVRDALLANCGLRLCLRVHAAADSQAVIGDPRAALLPPGAPGRCLLGQVGQAEQTQIALASERLIAGIAREHRGAAIARRPWLDPLPPTVTLEEAMHAEGRGGSYGQARPGDADAPEGRLDGDADALVLGMIDDPAAQSQYPAVYSPQTEGPLLCIGDPRSGKTTLLQTLSRQCGGTLILRGVEECWDAVHDAAESCHGARPTSPRTLLIDDLDALLARMGDDYALELADTLALVLREAHALCTVVATCRRPGGRLGPLAGFFSRHLLLRIADRGDFALLSSDVHAHDPNLPPGGGLWRGRRLQVCLGEPPSESPARDLPGPGRSRPGRLSLIAASGGAVIVSRRPGPTLRRLREAGVAAQGLPVRRPPTGIAALPEPEAHPVVVADPESWQSDRTAFAAYSALLPVVFESCAPVDVRLLTGSRDLPPALEPYAGHVWIWEAEGSLRRGILRASA